MTAYDILQAYIEAYGEGILDLHGDAAVRELQEYADKYHRALTDVECEVVLTISRNAYQMRKWEASGQGRLF